MTAGANKESPTVDATCIESAEYDTVDLTPLLLAPAERRKSAASTAPDGLRSAQARDTCLRAIRDSLRQRGFFIALVPRCQPEVDAVYEAMMEFYSLPTEEKELSHHSTSPKHGGYFRRGEEPVYTVGGPASHVEDFCVGYHIARHAELWSKLQVWPRKPRTFKQVVRQFLECMAPVVEALHRAVQEAFRLPAYGTADTSSILRMLRYPPGAHGNISAHTDFEVLSVLHQTQPGLQLLVDGEWRWAPCPEDVLAGPAAPSGGEYAAFLVMADDVLEFWTNGHVRALQHRVVSCGAPRLSLVLFLAAEPDQPAHPLEEYVRLAGGGLCRSFLEAQAAAAAAVLTQGAHLDTKVLQAEANMLTSE